MNIDAKGVYYRDLNDAVYNSTDKNIVLDNARSALHRLRTFRL